MKLDTRLRFAFIETRLYWEGGLKANDLLKHFELSRQTAQGVIEAYRQQYPNQMYYDKHKKCHFKTETFEAQHISTRSADFLDFLRGEDLIAHYLDFSPWGNVPLHDVNKTTRPIISEKILLPLLHALRHQKNLWIQYQPKMPDPITARIVSPNQLVFADNRYHLHAYCHTLEEHRDFVLSRMIEVKAAEKDWISEQKSKGWSSWVTLVFRVNPQLSERVQRSVSAGFEGQGVRRIRCRQHDAYYIQRQLRQQKDSDSKLDLWIEETGML
jgi:hypothetical protein